MTQHRRIRIGTRGSLLARTQTDAVVDALRRARRGVQPEVVTIRTSGDEASRRGGPLPPGKGWFTREIEQALLDGRIDLAVHSLKDLPTVLPPGLAVGAVPRREDPADVVVGCSRDLIAGSGPEFRIGTGSTRRAAQLRRLFPGVNVVGLRGNIDTRLAKVSDGRVHAAVLAAAGLNRLGMTNRIGFKFTPAEMLPAPGQGALAIETRAADTETARLLLPLHCPETAACVAAERAFMNRLGGGCHAPVAALAELQAGELQLCARVISLDGIQVYEGAVEAAPEDAEEMGSQLAEELAEQGAGELLESLGGTRGQT